MRRRVKILAVVALAAAPFALPAFTGRAAAAGARFVATTGNDSNDCLTPGAPCKTIQAAVNKAADGDTISVAAGNYPAPVNIFQRKNLTIQGGAGVTVSDPGLPLGAAVVIMSLSENIRLRDITFSGNRAGVEAIRIFDSTGISVDRCVIQQASLGFFINHSGVRISDSTVQDNGSGIRVDGQSAVSLNSAPFSPGTSTVQRNGNGVIVRSGDFGMLGATVIQENGVGINGTGGLVRVCCQDGLRKINDNGNGMVLRGVNLELRGPLEMAGNRGFALATLGGYARLFDRISIHNNGAPDGGAVLVIGGRLDLDGFVSDDIKITDNPGTGMLLTDGATSRISNTLISNNGQHGLRLEAMSVARLFDTAVMKDNGGFDCSCTPNSFGHGDRGGVRRMFCPGFDQSPNPAPGLPDGN